MVWAQCNQSFCDRTAAGIKGPPGQAESPSLRSPAPALKRVVATRARSTSVLAQRRESPRSVPPASPASPSSPAPGPGGRGRGGPAPLTHHLQPPSRARSKSQDFEPGHRREGRGGSTWESAARPRRRPPASASVGSCGQEGWRPPAGCGCPAAVAAPLCAAARPAPPCTRGQWSRPRKLG